MDAYLCLPIDVVRKYNPQVKQDQIQGPYNTEADARASVLGSEDDYELILSEIESTESILQNRLGHSYKMRSAGNPGNKRTWVTPRKIIRQTKSFAFPRFWVNWPHENIMPYDESKDDQFEIRTGNGSDDWDKLDEDDFTLDEEDGTMIVKRYRPLSEYYDHPGNSIRGCYRHGALGANDTMAGQTTVSEAVQTGTGTFTLEDAGHLPRFPQTFQIDGEYVRGEVDHANGEIELTARGRQGTTDTEHDSGSTIHYCPMDVRSAVASKVAIWLANSSVKVDQIAGEGIDPESRMKTWKGEWENLTDNSGKWYWM